MKIRILLLPLLFGLLLPGICQANDLDKLLSSLLVGSWEEGIMPYSLVSFKKDGTYLAEIYETSLKKRRLLKMEGNWSIKNSEVHSVLTASSSAKAPVGESFVDRIVQINQSEIILIGVDGKQYSKFRVTPRE